MSEIKLTYTGGPAFPVDLGTLKGGSFGLTKREWFAGMALQGLISHCAADYSSGSCNAVVVERAYLLADAMINRRKR